MMPGEYLKQISHPDLRQVANHWFDARGQRLMPAWEDIRPQAIAHQLKYTWAYRYQRESQQFIGRLAGVSIEARVHKSFRGHPMEDMFSGKELDWIRRCCLRVINSKSLHCGSGPIIAGAHPLGMGERIVMPLATDGVNADGVLGATIYPESAENSVMDFYEREIWLPLIPAGK